MKFLRNYYFFKFAAYLRYFKRERILVEQFAGETCVRPSGNKHAGLDSVFRTILNVLSPISWGYCSREKSQTIIHGQRTYFGSYLNRLCF